MSGKRSKRQRQTQPRPGSSFFMIESGGHYYREDELREIENYESEIELLAELENLADRLELINDTIAARVEAARAVDAEWGEIGRALGITGDTARKRYSK